MQKDLAKKIIQDTLQNSFNKQQFKYFIKNLLNHIEEEGNFIYRGNYISDSFADSIKSLERIGKYKDPEGKLIDILIVKLKKEHSLERARTTQRNFIAKYLKGSRGELKDAALVAFVSPNEDDWRFSLVKMEYKFNDKGKVKEEFTPARRYSFLVGKNENSHTAQSRLLPLLLNDEVDPTLAELEEAFSAERVTKEFFQKYRDLFLRIKESLDDIISKDKKIKADFEKKNVNTVDFAKKLLGQIAFLYFLQKKGWFGVARGKDWGQGDRKFLRTIFEKAQKENKNYFNDFLEPLFYEALRLERPDDYYSYFNCRIPFLNGGLFDPIGDYDWWEADIFLPNDLFSNDRKTKEGDIGDGILDIFDRYNFTVKEDEPLEKEVAIDPEMLGKVFENLLEIKDRKSKGTYYTPREIVHYMCQESLANYLATELKDKVKKDEINILIKYGDSVIEHDSHVVNKGYETKDYSFKLPESIRKHAELIDEKLATIRVCDPAVGSGAFIVGMMNEIVRTRKALTPYIKEKENADPTTYHFKRHAIQNSLYGVDIDSGAVEITKLRLWLSLIVDEENRETIQPLPNLDYKIMQGNSLLSEFMGIDLDKESDDQNKQILSSQTDIDVLIEQLKIKKDEYLNKSSASEKQRLKQEIEDLIIKIFEEKLKEQKNDYFNKIKAVEEKYKVLPNAQQREDIIKKEKEKLYKTSGFNLDQFEKQLREYTTHNKIRPFFPWKLYFAEVFYQKDGFDVIIGNPPYIQLQKEGGKLAKLFSKQNFRTFARTGDIYTLFYEKGMQLLRQNGVLCYITSNKWMRAAYGEKLRRFFLDYNPLALIDLGPGVFENATVDTNILLIQKANNNNKLLAVTLQKEDNNTDIAKQLKERGIILNKLSKDAWFIGSSAEQKLKEKIEKIGKPLKDWDVKIYYGIKTGLNEAFIITTEKRNEILANCKDDASAGSASERKRTEAIIKPILRGRDIKRYSYEWAGLWVIVIPAGWTNENRGKIPPEKFILEQFPSLMNHIKPFEEKAKKRDDQGDYWWELRHCSYYPEFEKEKVVYPNMATRLMAIYDIEKFYTNQKCFIITGDNLKYITGLFNSEIAFWYFKNMGATLGREGYEMSKIFMQNLPLPPITPANQPIVKQIEALVDKILSAKKSNPQADTSQWEKEIDKLVYSLYGLDEEEIRIIEK